MIRNIIFDMGNVLLDYNPERPLHTFMGQEEDRAIIRKELFNGPNWVEGDYGYITNEERYELVKPRVPERLHKQLKDCVLHWPDFLEEVPGAAGFVKKMREDGYGIYVLSNACSAFHKYFPDFLPEEYFDGIVVSSDIHLIKPDRKIYEYLLQRYGLLPEECLFIDDREENVEGAIRCGMNAIVFDGEFDKVEEILGK